MKTLEQIRWQLVEGEFNFSHHAFRRAVERNISEGEIREAGANALLIEEYPQDKYGPTILVFGFSKAGRPLHIQASAADSPRVRIITIYEPNPHQWRNYVERR